MAVILLLFRGLAGFFRFITDVLGFPASALSSASALSVLVVAATSGAALIPLLAAGNALGLFRFGWQSFGDAFRRLPERKMTWGTVFDSHTLRPIPFSVVRLMNEHGRVMEERVADGLGRYAFLAMPQSLSAMSIRLRLQATHRGYTFPAAHEGMERLLFGNPYRGDIITVNEGALINFDIPMDAAVPRSAERPVKAPRVAAGAAVAAMADAGLWVGLVSVPLGFILEPGSFSLGILFLFLGVASLRLFGITERPFGTVSDSQGRAVPFALMTVHADSGKRVAYTVSDERGRYFLSIERGSYVLTVRTPANTVPARHTERSIVARKGWVTQQVIV